MHTLSLGWGVAQGVQAGHLPRDRPSPTLSPKAVQQAALTSPPNENHTWAWASPRPRKLSESTAQPRGKRWSRCADLFLHRMILETQKEGPCEPRHSRPRVTAGPCSTHDLRSPGFWSGMALTAAQ